MDCQFNQLAGAPIGLPVGTEARAGLVANNCGGPRNIAVVGAMLEAFASVLTAEEVLLGAALHGPAGGIREAVEVIRSVVREAIEVAIIEPGDTLARIALLRHAVDFEGADGPLVGRIALALATNVVPATAA